MCILHMAIFNLQPEKHYNRIIIFSESTFFLTLSVLAHVHIRDK